MSSTNKPNAAVTICAANFLPKARILRDSYLNCHPESDFHILIVDRKDPELARHYEDLSLIWVEDLAIRNFYSYAFRYDVIELSTNVKPAVLKLLLQQYESVLYLDPDIRVFSYLSPVFESLQIHSIVVTPHALTPVLDGKNPADDDFLRFGSFNLGFVGVSRCEEAFRFLDWWSDRCLELGFYEPQLGLAVDQGWVALAPAYFPNLKILRDLGLNVAFWNLHERSLSCVAGKWVVNKTAPLYFFHFSSFPVDQPHAIAHKQSRFAPDSRPDLNPLLDDYAAELRKCDPEKQYSMKPYSFDFFLNGTYISPATRRFYEAVRPELPDAEDPFSPQSRFYRFAISRGLAKEGYRPAIRYTFRDMGKFSAAIRVISLGLYCVLRMIGPNRYFALMKYLVHISSIRNQKDVICYRA